MYSQQKKYSEAEEYYGRFVEVIPNKGSGHYYLGDVLERQNKNEEVLSHFEKALELAEAMGQKDLAESVRKRLKKYRKLAG
jgi:tetratricopeptide (TPR) repeat protein